jgi:hypothetical protein
VAALSPVFLIVTVYAAHLLADETAALTMYRLSDAQIQHLVVQPRPTGAARAPKLDRSI